MNNSWILKQTARYVLASSLRFSHLWFSDCYRRPKYLNICCEMAQLLFSHWLWWREKRSEFGLIAHDDNYTVEGDGGASLWQSWFVFYHTRVRGFGCGFQTLETLIASSFVIRVWMNHQIELVPLDLDSIKLFCSCQRKCRGLELLE